MNIIILVILILLNGVFAMSEIALVTARKARLSAQAEQGDKAAAKAIELGENPTRFLSTVQIGITSIGLLSGIFGEAALSPHVAAWFIKLGMPAATAAGLATALVVIAITYASIVLGELVPKRIGQIKAESVARLVARPMSILSAIARPFVALLSASTNGLMKLLRIKDDPEAVTEEDINAVLDQGSQAGVIESEERDMVRNVFHLDDRRLSSLIVPRSEVVCLDVQDSVDNNIQKILNSSHTRFPVCDGGLDNVKGVISAKQVLTAMLRQQKPDFEHGLDKPLFVPETLTGLDLLMQFKQADKHMAIVVDEYGAAEGIVTLQDLLEAVTGEFAPPHGEELEAIKRADGSWLLDGSLSMVEIKDYLQLKSIPDEGRPSYHTLSGMLMFLLGRIPVTGESADWENWTFEVVDMDNKHIDRVLASPVISDSEIQNGKG